jgi:hypothetical protein
MSCKQECPPEPENLLCSPQNRIHELEKELAELKTVK